MSLRLGNPAKVTEKIQHLTLDYILCDEFTTLRDLQYKATQATYGSADSEGKYENLLRLNNMNDTS